MSEKECIDTYRQECVQLRARIAQLEAQLGEVRAHRDRERRQNKRLSAENAGLREDRERINWYSTHGRDVYPAASGLGWCAGGDIAYTLHVDLGSAIDAARSGK